VYPLRESEASIGRRWAVELNLKGKTERLDKDRYPFRKTTRGGKPNAGGVGCGGGGGGGGVLGWGGGGGGERKNVIERQLKNQDKVHGLSKIKA